MFALAQGAYFTAELQMFPHSQILDFERSRITEV